MIRLLILPGDIRYNQGDIAICLAVVRLIKKAIRGAQVFIWSKSPYLPGGFDGVHFESSGIFRKLKTLLTAQIVLWGGGQLLQGNRSIVKIPFWIARILLLRIFGKKIMGFAQGIGPLSGWVSRKLVRFAVGCSDVFTVRDHQSMKILMDMHVPKEKIFLTADPSITLLQKIDTLRKNEAKPIELQLKSSGIIGLSLRYTFHHRQNRLIPFQLLPARLRRHAFNSKKFHHFVSLMIALCDRIIEELNVAILIIPMYMAPWESDDIIAKALARGISRRERVHIFYPKHSVEETLNMLRQLDAFIGTPMHATIFATSHYVPTIALYYEPKGKEYFHLIGQEELALPLEEIWDNNGTEKVFNHIRMMWSGKDRIRKDLIQKIPEVYRRANLNEKHLSSFLIRSRLNKRPAN